MSQLCSPLLLELTYLSTPGVQKSGDIYKSVLYNFPARNSAKEPPRGVASWLDLRLQWEGEGGGDLTTMYYAIALVD